ncbi:hypothetical protein OY671_009816, partial [Metschnikowia pulcherrima]
PLVRGLHIAARIGAPRVQDVAESFEQRASQPHEIVLGDVRNALKEIEAIEKLESPERGDWKAGMKKKIKKTKARLNTKRAAKSKTPTKALPAKPRSILLPEKNGPLVHLELALTHGSSRDPQGKEGTASLTSSMLSRGTRKKSSSEFHRALDNIGAEIHLGKYKESQRIY